MKTNLLKLTCTLVGAMACVSVNAQNYCGYPNEEDVTWEFNDNQLVFQGTGAIKEYSHDMPTAYPWFAHYEDVQSVIIGEGITSIPAWAFAMYENLRSIQLPSTLKTIGWSCLEETNVWNVALPEGLEKIESYAFMMTPFSSVSIPSTVTEIGERAFGYCDDLVSIGCYADTPPTLGDKAFGDSPIETVYVKSENTATYKAASGWADFGDKIQSPAGYCGPNGYDEDGDDDVKKATWTFDMGTHTLTISGTKLGQYNRPWNSAGMGGQGGGFNPDNNVGYPCGIYHLVVEEGIAVIPAMEFYMNLAITDVTLPSTLTSIGMGAFGENFALKSVTINATTPPTLGEDVFMDMAEIPTVYVPAVALDTYKTAAGWSAFADKIVEQGGAPAATTTTFAYTASEKLTIFDDISNFIGATAVKSHEFAGGTGTVVYEGTVTSIADYTFRYDDTAKNKMTGIVLPSSLTSTGDYTFWYCEQLTSVSFEGTPTLTTIGKSAFNRCTSLSSFAVPASVESIGVGAFKDCSSLTTVTFVSPSSVTTINQSAFSACTMLTSISLPESLTTLGSVQTDPQLYYNGSVFWNSGITSIVIPKNVTTIYGSGYFADCNMTSVTVDAENPKYADLGCNGIFEKATNKLVVGCNITTIPDGITTIGYESFWAVTAPFDLVLPESVTTIEGRAFHLTDGLRSINIPSGITFIDEENFICSNLTDVYCYASSDINWEGGMKWAFAYPKSTIFHVADAAEWETKFPEANAFFVSDLVDFTLAEDAENTGAIGSRNGHEVNATLTRTLKAGSWNTFAAPFDIDAATMTAKGITAKELTASSLTSGTLTLTFADASAIEAGKPYLVKVAADIVNPFFENVTIESALTPSETGNVVFVPTTGKTLVTGPTGHENDESSVLFLANGNELQYPSVVNTPAEADSYLKGFRAYFQLKDGAAARDFRLDLGEGELTGIADTTLLINNESIMNNDIYNLSGQKVNGKLAKGLYIVNGRKVVVK